MMMPMPIVPFVLVAGLVMPRKGLQRGTERAVCVCVCGLGGGGEGGLMERSSSCAMVVVEPTCHGNDDVMAFLYVQHAYDRTSCSCHCGCQMRYT